MVKWLRLPENLTELKSLRVQPGGVAGFVEMLSSVFPANDLFEKSTFAIVIFSQAIEICRWGREPKHRLEGHINFKDLE
jgi:hypothetical protein